MIARICVLAFVVLGLGSAGAEISTIAVASGPSQQWQTIPDESAPNGPPTECNGSLKSGPSLDDPNVDTDPERPITEKAADDEGDQSDDDADGACRSETLELWFQPDPDDFIVQAMAEIARAHG